MTRQDLLNRMSSAEFAYWVAFYIDEANAQANQTAELRRKEALAQRGITA